MFEPEIIKSLSNEIASAIFEDRNQLQTLRNEMRPLKSSVRKIQKRSAVSVSIVGTDGGNNRVHFDPFLIQIIRVVDSSKHTLWQEVVTLNADFDHLVKKHLSQNGEPISPLGKMMKILDVTRIEDLSPVFKHDADKRSPSWIQVYRELTEWAVLLKLIRETDFGTDTLVIFDGFLRSKMFKNHFGNYRKALEEGIDKHAKKRRKVYVAGIAKHSKFLQKYRLAMALEGIMRNAFPCYLEIDKELEKKVYKWSESATGGSEREQFVAGKMFLVKFGKGLRDPIWAIDLLISQADLAPITFGYMLNDAKRGFPVSLYPRSLQIAHEHAELVDFDMDIIQNLMKESLRGELGDKKSIIDELVLMESDPSGKRYT